MECIQTQRVFNEVPEGPVAGASLFVFSIDPLWGNIYFWLGKERRNLRWPEGSETWSDFGGRPIDDTEDPPHIAAREFWEETCAMLPYFNHDTIPRPGMEDIAASLRRHEYLFCVTMWTRTPKGEKRLFVTYVKQVPWTPSAFHSFQEAHQYLHKLRSQAAAGALPCMEEVLSVFAHPSISTSPHVTISKDFLEKKSIRMWSIPQLRAAIELQLLREEREKERKKKSFGSSSFVLSAASTVDHLFEENAPDCPDKSELVVKSLAVRAERFRPCFISMATVILKELPLYEPLVNEKNKMCRV